MHIPAYVRIGCAVAAVLSLFWLPWPCALALMFLTGLAFPPAAFAIGALADILYYPGSGLPWGVLAGLLCMLAAVAVRHFVKTRIM